ncbi:MAG: fluoride efflux transporter CrcB [Pseudomonadota bacterium]|jgi:CrcB protein
MHLIYIAAGGALGSVARYYATLALTAVAGAGMPWGTVLVNITGSFVIGCAAGAFSAGSPASTAPFVRYFLMVGLCGGYTTFSAFSLQTVHMLQDGLPVRALCHALLSVCACVAATMIGYSLAATLTR